MGDGTSWPQTGTDLHILTGSLATAQGLGDGLLFEDYAGLLQVDMEKKQVTVEAGILLADLQPQLDKRGLALSK